MGKIYQPAFSLILTELPGLGVKLKSSILREACRLMDLYSAQIQGSHALIKGKIGLQSTNSIASLSKYPAKAIEGSRLNWEIYLDDSVDRKAIPAELY